MSQHPDKNALLTESAKDAANQLGSEKGSSRDLHVKTKLHVGAITHRLRQCGVRVELETKTVSKTTGMEV